MNEILYTLLVTVTIYHADPKQTDNTLDDQARVGNDLW